jgi:hypothetical protein
MRQKIDPFYVCEDGRKIPLQAISMLEMTEIERGVEADYRERGEPVDQPTYEATTVGGDVITYPLTEDSLVVDGNEEETAKRKEAWERYIDTTERMKAEITQITMQMIIEDGIVVKEIPEEWKTKMARRKVRLPSNPEDLRTFYIMSQYLRTPMDIAGVQLQIIQISSSGVLKDTELEAAKDAFFRSLQETSEGSS